MTENLNNRIDQQIDQINVSYDTDGGKMLALVCLVKSAREEMRIMCTRDHEDLRKRVNELQSKLQYDEEDGEFGLMDELDELRCTNKRLRGELEDIKREAQQAKDAAKVIKLQSDALRLRIAKMESEVVVGEVVEV